MARDSKYLAIFEGRLPHIYFPIAQDPSFMRIVSIRARAPLAALAPWSSARSMRSTGTCRWPISVPLEQVVNTGLSYLIFRIGTIQSGAMGLLGLLLSVVGCTVSSHAAPASGPGRWGSACALGAEPKDVRGLVLRQGGALVLTGIACGLGLATMVTRAMSRLFVLVGTIDVPAFAGVTVLLGTIALVACYLPARRAMRVDPIIALRHE